METRSQTGDKTTRLLKPVVFCDFDGTITQLDVTDEILARFAHPSWREIEQAWACGSIGSRECLERQMALVEASAAELNALIDAVPVDPHLVRFVRFAEARRLPFYVLSDSFDYVVRRVLKRAGINGRLRNGMNFFASALRRHCRRWVTSFPHSVSPCTHGCATCKAEILRRLGSERSPIIFIGDGLSDRFAVKEADLVFAKRQLLAYCREEGIACRPFETFGEIEFALRQLIDSGQPVAPRRTVKSRKPKVRE
jgi:2-hydroxy-3-keto-5-methylthiopentenyl-1-phosphate phosphatase